MGRGRRQKRRKKQSGKRIGVLVVVLGFLFVAGLLFGYNYLSDSDKDVEFPEQNIAEEEVADGFYYQQLNSQEQLVYREILQGVRSMEETVLLHAGEQDDVGKVYEYLMYDRPELFWCDGSSQMTVYEKDTEFHPSYTCTAEQKEARQTEIDTASQEILAGAQAKENEYEKIKYIFETLVNTVDYDENALDNQNIYSSLVWKKSVCAGYSRGAQYLLNQLGMECIYVTGTVSGQDSHAWNIVNCDGKYYQMDVTFGDPVFQESETGETIPNDIVNYEYLCCTDEEIFIDHKQDTSVPYPVCDSEDLNYYRMNGLYFESYDADQILGKMKEGIAREEELFTVRFSDANVYEMAKEDILQRLIPHAAQDLAEKRGIEQVKYTYAVEDQKKIVMIFWDYAN